MFRVEEEVILRTVSAGKKRWRDPFQRSGRLSRMAAEKEGYPLMIKANVLRILTMLIRAYQDESKPGNAP